jgi:murein L,D-transpeptidase YafK
MMRLLVVLCCASIARADRLGEVRRRRTEDVKALVAKAGLRYPVEEVYLRAFKQERTVELWGGARGAPLVLIKSYPVCAASGDLGPKRKEGDLQVPEGLYEIAAFNPASTYHLSLKVSYPNASDRLRSDPRSPGGLIYLHGHCVSIGCIAIEDDPIEEVYLIAADSLRRPLRFDIFPARLTARGVEGFATDARLPFWLELAPAFAQFEQTRRPARFQVSATGAYRVVK